MAKKKRNKKSRVVRRNESRVSTKSGDRKRNLIFTSVLGVSVIAIVALLILGGDSSSRSSDDASTSVNPGEDTRAEQVPTPASTGHGPSIHFPESSYDFGSISQGDKVSHTFIVENKGDEPLKLIRAKGS